MNKLLRYSFVALLAMIGLNVSAQEVTIDFSGSTDNWGIGTTKLVEAQSFTYGGYTITLEGTTGNGYRWYDSGNIILGKQGATLTLPAFDFDVERIDVVGTSGASASVKQNIFVGDDAVSTETTGAKDVTNMYVIADAKQAAGTIYTLKVTSAHNTQITKIMIWKKGTSGDTPQSENPKVASVAELNALQNNDLFTYTGEALVVYVNGSYAYIKDETGSSLIYDNGKTKLANLAIGKKISANWNGKVSVYRNLFEAVPDDVLAVTNDAAAELTYPEATMSDMLFTNMNQVVVIKGVTYTTLDGKNFTIAKGDAQVNGYNTFNLEIAAPEDGKSYNITGVISVYNTNVQFLPIAIEEATGGATESGVIYSWESPEGTVIETGGSATYENGETDESKYRVNYANAGYYTICVNGKKGNMGDAAGSANGGYILVTLDNELKADDAIALTGYINKNESKEASIFFQFEKGDGVNDDYIFGDADNIDTTIGGKINTHVFQVPASADGSKNFKMSRNKAGTNIFLTKLVITRGGATGINTVENVRINNGAIYNLAGQKVGKDYKGIVIINGKKFVVK